MKRGLLIYDEAGAKRNEWFIKECILAAAEVGLDLRLKIYRGEGMIYGKKNPDFVIVRTIDLELTRWLDEQGIRMFNNRQTEIYANDKWQTYQLAKKLGLPVMPTETGTAAMVSPFGYPAVMKHRKGHGGKQVYLLNSEEEYRRLWEGIAYYQYVVQPMCSCPGKDMRLYMLGGSVLGAVLRTSETDFRSNYSLGGKVQLVEAPPETVAIARTLYNELGFDFVGVDFIEHEGKWVLNEIEDVVGSRMLYETSTVDVARTYLNHIAKKLREAE